VVFDVIGGDVQQQSAALIKTGGTLVSVVGPVEARPADGLAVDFVVEADRTQLGEIVQRVRDGRLRPNIGDIARLDDTISALTRPRDAAGRQSSAYARRDPQSRSGRRRSAAREVPGHHPGYHMDKRHWITLEGGGTIDEKLVEELVIDSCRLVVAGLPGPDRPVDPHTHGRRT
jgi:hypothetical protein